MVYINVYFYVSAEYEEFDPATMDWRYYCDSETHTIFYHEEKEQVLYDNWCYGSDVNDLAFGMKAMANLLEEDVRFEYYWVRENMEVLMSSLEQITKNIGVYPCADC